MSVYKRPGSTVYQYEFEYKTVRYRGTTRATNKGAALLFEAKRRQEQIDDYAEGRSGAQRVTLEQLATMWLKASEDVHADHRNNISRVRKLFGSGLQKVNADWLEVADIRFGLPRDLMVHELDQRTMSLMRDARIREGNSPGTINREIALVQAMIGYAESVKIVTPTPSIQWHVKRNKAASLKMRERAPKLRWLKASKEAALLASLEANALKYPNNQAARDNFDLTMFLLDTGARYSEIASIRWEMIDLGAGTIELYRSKVNNESILTLPARTLGMLKARWSLLEGMKIDYVFPTLKGLTWTGENKPRGHATASIQRHIGLLGLNANPLHTRVTPHTFRDTFASRLVQAGVSLLKVSHLLGHANQAMSAKYAHLCPEATGAEAAVILNRLHDGRPVILAQLPFAPR